MNETKTPEESKPEPLLKPLGVKIISDKERALLALMALIEGGKNGPNTLMITRDYVLEKCRAFMRADRPEAYLDQERIEIFREMVRKHDRTF